MWWLAFQRNRRVDTSVKHIIDKARTAVADGIGPVAYGLQDHARSWVQHNTCICPILIIFCKRYNAKCCTALNLCEKYTGQISVLTVFHYVYFTSCRFFTTVEPEWKKNPRISSYKIFFLKKAFLSISWHLFKGGTTKPIIVFTERLNFL